jgi:hypothetical protein
MDIALQLFAGLLACGTVVLVRTKFFAITPALVSTAISRDLKFVTAAKRPTDRL